MQKGKNAMAKKKYGETENLFKSTLKKTPEDYAGLLMMSKCLLAQKK
jgi:thioredoxin-like negative regulator of GroEL